MKTNSMWRYAISEYSKFCSDSSLRPWITGQVKIYRTSEPEWDAELAGYESRLVAAKARLADIDAFDEFNEVYKNAIPETKHGKYPVREPSQAKDLCLNDSGLVAIIDLLAAPKGAERYFVDARTPGVRAKVENRAIPELYGPYSYRVDVFTPDGDGIFLTAAECGNINKNIENQYAETMNYLCEIASVYNRKKEYAIKHAHVIYTKPEVKFEVRRVTDKEAKHTFEQVSKELLGIPFMISAAGTISSLDSGRSESEAE